MRVSQLVDTSKINGSVRDFLERMRSAYDAMYDVTDVVRGYAYYQKMLLEKAIAIYVYDGLPDSIPAVELERLLMTLGRCVFVDDPIYGLVVLPCTFSGIGVYRDFPPRVQWATPLISGAADTADVCIGYNNSTHIGLAETIDRYARILADVESTLSSQLYILRKPSYASAPDQNAAESYNAALLANRLGQNAAVFDDPIMSGIKMLPVVNSLSNNALGDIYECREQILKMFLAEIGVQYGDAKRERMSVDEVAVNTQALIVNSADMLASRERMCERLNELYGLNISVKINPAYDVAAYYGASKGEEMTSNAAETGDD